MRSAVEALRAYWRSGGIWGVPFLYRAFGRRTQVEVSPHRVSLGDLEAVLERAGGLREFLQSSALQEDYFGVVSRYYGKKKLPRESYYAIMKQLQELHATAPSLAERLWQRPESSVRFTIKTKCPTSGRALNPLLWRSYRAGFLQSLRARCGVSSPDQRDFTLQENLLALATGDLRRRMAVFRERKNGLRSKREQRNLRGAFYKALRKDPRFQSVAAFLVYRFFVMKQSEFFFEVSDADLVIDFFRQLQQNPAQIIEPEDDGGELWVTFVKALLPRPSELLADKLLFPVVHRRLSSGKTVPVGCLPYSEFVTRTVRPIHAVWCGIPLHDCLGGEVSSLRNLTPRRWAIGGLRGALSFVVERNGVYQGSVRLIPMMGPGRRLIYSFAPSIPLFSAKVVVDDSHATRSLVEHWVAELRRVAQLRAPFALSQSRSSDVSQLKEVLRDIPGFFANVDIGLARDFKVTDPEAEAFLEKIPLPEDVRQYGEDFIFDATLFDAGQLDLISATIPRPDGRWLSDHSERMERSILGREPRGDFPSPSSRGPELSQ